MIESVFGLYVLQFLLVVVGLWGYHLISRALADSQARLDALAQEYEPDYAGFADQMRNTVQEIVEDTLQSLEPPRAVDHIFGALAQMIQARTMQMMNPQGLIGMAVETVQDMVEDSENV